MRVSVSGTHSTGKTSLVAACRELLARTQPELEVSYIGEVARQVIAMGLPLNREATLESYLRYIRMQLQAERETTAETVISDRSLVDSLAYLETSRIDAIPEAFVGLMREIVQAEKRYFDVYVYVPIEFGLESDRVRPSDTRYQEDVEDKLAEILRRYRMPCVEVHGPTPQRAEQIVGLLAGHPPDGDVRR